MKSDWGKKETMEFRDLKRQYEYLKPEIDAAIADVISSSRFIGGKHVTELEEKLADYVGVKHCITCGNGTDALTVALKAWGIGPGDAVFVPDFTFFSSGECPATEGATPVFVDVDYGTCNMDPKRLEETVDKVVQEGKQKPRVVVAVDLFGQCADYDAIRDICRKHKLLLLEDGAQGFGGTYKGARACSFGDIATTSFFPAKPLGCYGDGGAVFTDDDDWADYIRSIVVHGKDTSNPSDPNAKYNNVRLGMNSRLDSIQAAILLPKLKALQDYELDKVEQAAEQYDKLFAGSGIDTPVIAQDCVSSWAQYTVKLPKGVNRAEVQQKLKEQGIPTNVYYKKPMHQQGAFAGTPSAKALCLVTEDLCERVLSLPMSPYVTDEEITQVTIALKNSIS